MITVITSIHILLLVYKVCTQFINNANPGYMPYELHRQYYDEYDYRRWGPARQGNRVYRRGGGRFPEYSMESNYEYDRVTKCKCSCKNCEYIRPCCRSVCVNCNPQSSLIFVPYPIPLVVTIQPKSSPTTSTTTTTTRTTTSTTSSTEATTTATVTTYSTPLFPNSAREKYREPPDSDYEMSTFPFFDTKKKLSLIKKRKPECLRGRCKLKNYRRLDYIDGALRHNDEMQYDRGLRSNQMRAAQSDKYYNVQFPSESNNWSPRYGIVPIPDKLALKFMTHLRDMKLENLERGKDKV